MEKGEERPSGQNRHQSIFDSLHIFALVGLAISQPLFDVLSTEATFFVARGSLRIDLFLMTAGLVVLLPLPLVALECIAGLIDTRLRRGLHLFWIAVLTAFVLMPLIKTFAGDNLTITLVGATAGGVLASIAYARTTLVRSFLTMLSPAPIIFAFLFLLNPSVAKLLRTDSAIESTQHHPGAPTSVVLLVFDELPLTSLTTKDGEIDASLFPNFARLASQSTWFQNATTNHNTSELAVPAILSGITPSDPTLLPIQADYPRNVFALLSQSHRMEIWETFTGLWVDPQKTEDVPPLAERLTSLADDLLIVYAHIVLPEALTSDLPSLESKWGDFQDTDQQDLATARGRKTQPLATGQKYGDKASLMRGFIDAIGAPAAPTFYFLHFIFPHSPWEYLPTGERYALTTLRSPGRFDHRWLDSEWWHAIGYQRHLLQIGFLDALLGTTLDQLEETGLYERALIIVLADHGISFRAKEPVRSAGKKSLRDIVNIPFFVKRPFQKVPAKSDRAVESIDVLPTIADVLDINLLWDVDGFSVFDKHAPERSEKILYGNKKAGGPLSYDAETVLSQQAAIDAKAQLFSEGSGWERVYAMGPRPDLLGRGINDFEMAPALPAGLVLMDRWRFDSVGSERGTVPAFIRGEIFAEPGQANRLPREVAVLINGQVRGVTATHPLNVSRPDTTHFAVMVSPGAFKRGFNTIDIYGVGDDSQLAPIPGVNYELNVDRILTNSGLDITIEPRALKTKTQRVKYRKGKLHVAGWAYDKKKLEPAEAIMVFENGKHLLSARLNKKAPKLKKRLGTSSAVAGFSLTFPVQASKKNVVSQVRIFAVRGSTATEISLEATD